MTKIAMTGGGGRVGKYLQEEGVIPLVCNVTSPEQILDSMSTEKPDIVVHLAALSDVDYCEINQQDAINVNLKGTYNVLYAAESLGVKVVMLSTDHVFRGKEVFKWSPYGELDTPNPVNFYGKSKLAAEALQEAFAYYNIIRTSYLFDEERLARKIEESQPSFILRSFMYLPHFVSNLMEYLHRWDEMPSILHISGGLTVSWYKFMGEYLGNVDIKHHDKEIYSTKNAPRPYRAGLTTKYTNLLPSYNYRDGFEAMK